MMVSRLAYLMGVQISTSYAAAFSFPGDLVPEFPLKLKRALIAVRMRKWQAQTLLERLRQKKASVKAILRREVGVILLMVPQVVLLLTVVDKQVTAMPVAYRSLLMWFSIIVVSVV